jgi:serine/threonine protein kinase
MSIFSNNTIEVKHKRVLYTIPKHIFLKVDSSDEIANKSEYKGTFGLYTANVESYLDGAYSIVLKYEDKTTDKKENSRIALKVSSHTKTNYRKIKQELDIYNILRKQKDYSKYVCACYGIETLKHGRKTFNYLTMEYLTCDLFDFIFKHKRPYSNKNIYSILSQTLNGLDFLHKNNIIYNDLKMENIMISGLKCNSETGETTINVKLIDFNCSTIIVNSNVEIGGGTLEYMSPELQKCVHRHSFKTLTPKSDVWSFGLLVCMLFLNYQPYEAKTGKLIIKNIQTNIYDDIDKCILYVEHLKIDLSLPSFVRHSRTNEEFVICIMDMCFKTNVKERASMGDLTELLSSISI